MKLSLILLPLSMALAVPASATARRPSPTRPATAPAPADHGFDWLLGGLGLAIIIGAASARPRRMMKVSA